MGRPAKKICLRPGCGQDVQARGLCRHCYNVAKHAVKKGFATWDKLQEEGKVMPARSTHNPAIWGWVLDWCEDPAARAWKTGAPPAQARGPKKQVGWPKGKKRGPGRPKKHVDPQLSQAQPQSPVHAFTRTE